MRALLSGLISNTVFANLLLAAIVVAGAISAASLIRESMPNVMIEMVIVEIPYPGADPAEVEEGVSRRIETAVDGMAGVKQYHTTSYEGFAEAVIEIEEGFDVQQMKDRIVQVIDGLQGLPDGIEPARITIAENEEEVIDVALWGKMPERQLKVWAETIRSGLQALPNVSLVEINDTRDYEINVEISKEALLKYGLTLQEVSRAINQQSMSLSTGSIKSDSGEIRLRAYDRRFNGKEFGSIVVKAGPSGEQVTLDQIAEIRDEFTDDPAHATFNGEPCVLLWVEKAAGQDSIQIAAQVNAYVKQKQAELPEGLHITACFDDAEFIQSQISLLLGNGVSGLLVVLLILWLFLSTRLAFWVAMGIPISICGALVLMLAFGSTINQVTMISFIIVLGIIVDDAIVVGEAIYVHRKSGKSPLDAAVAGVQEVGLPVIAACLTTVIAFLPLALIPGIMGKIVGMIPLVVVSALLVSLAECLFLLPAHLNNLPELNEAPAPRHRFDPHRLQDISNRALEWVSGVLYPPLGHLAVHHRYLSLCVAVATLMVLAGVIGGKHLRVVFWPPMDGDHIRAMVEFPEGTPAGVTRDAVERTRMALEKVAAAQKTKDGQPLIRNLYTRVFPEMPHMGRISVEIQPSSNRSIESQALSTAWEKETGILPGALVQSFSDRSINVGGQYDLEIWLQGKDIEVLAQAATELKNKIRTYDGTKDVSDSFRPGKNELQVKLREEARAMGLSLADVSRQIYAGYYGEEAVRFQRGRDDVKVRVRYPKSERMTLAQLEQMKIRTADGNEAPLLSVALLESGRGYSFIEGSNGLRRVVVSANVDPTISSASEILEDLSANYLDPFAVGYPSLTWSIRGAAESNAETMAGVQKGFVLAILGIFVIMASIFRSYAQPFVILTIIPFGIVGACLGHLALGIPLTFLSLFGLIALCGVVVNDAIVLIECFNDLLKEGMRFDEALVNAGVRRFRPIFLTSATTCGGLMPLLFEQDLQAQIVIPMATSISFGVAFATVLTLLFIPALLGILNDTRRLLHRARHGVWPTPEQVEPGSRRGVVQGGAPAGLEPSFVK
ncbi:MAG: efflux RND transporter permease subunit [Candidatus Hydrogenedentes bacterium]|nr:efflux RND transporter permease subunit [Candidatus Hydrogenedentota bacterium]